MATFMPDGEAPDTRLAARHVQDPKCSPDLKFWRGLAWALVLSVVLWALIFAGAWAWVATH